MMAQKNTSEGKTEAKPESTWQNPPSVLLLCVSKPKQKTNKKFEVHYIIQIA
jgi:hypothetical protein